MRSIVRERTGDTGTSTSDQEVASSEDVETSEPSSVLFLGNAGDDDGDELAIEMAVRTKSHQLLSLLTGVTYRDSHGKYAS